MIIGHLVFMCFPLYEYFKAGGPTPYCLLDFSLTLWTICLVLGWAKAAKAMNEELLLEQAAQGAEGKSSACFEDKTKARATDPGWLLRCDSLATWPFKALYWFTLGYLHALVLMLLFGTLAYTMYVLAGSSKYMRFGFLKPRKKEIADNVWGELPALFSMRWLLVCFDEAFTWNHLAIYTGALVAAIVLGFVYLKREAKPGQEGYKEQQALRRANRTRMAFMHTICGACLDACYTILGFYFFLLPKPRVQGTATPVAAAA